MLDAPRQNWTAYADRVKPIDAAWLRALTCAERFDLYADMFKMVLQSSDQRKDQSRLEQWSWEQKVAARRRQLNAYNALDKLKRERAAAHDSH